MSIIRTTWDDPRSRRLRTALDDEMTVRYTGRHDDDPGFAEKAAVAFAVDPTAVVAVLLALDDGHDADGEHSAVGHAVLRRLGSGDAVRLEVKKVVVVPEARGLGVGRALMTAVDDVARENGARSLLLQTGDRQPDAIAMYENLGYVRIPVFDPYRPITNSVCFEKLLD